MSEVAPIHWYQNGQIGLKRKYTKTDLEQFSLTSLGISISSSLSNCFVEFDLIFRFMTLIKLYKKA